MLEDVTLFISILTYYRVVIYYTPTPSETVKAKLTLIFTTAVKEFGAPAHQVIKVRILVFLAVICWEFKAFTRPVCAIASTLPAVTTEPLSLSFVEMLRVSGAAVLCNV